VITRKTYGRSSSDPVVCDRIPRRRTLLIMQHRGRMPQGNGEEILMILKPRALPRCSNLVHILLAHLVPGKKERSHSMATSQHPRPFNRLNNRPWKTSDLHRPAKGLQPLCTNLLKAWTCHCQGQPRRTQLLNQGTWKPTLQQTPLKLRARTRREIELL
jgi:hypothetical protein